MNEKKLDKKTGLISSLIKVTKNVPFQSDALDMLAEVMQVTKILRKNKLDRYYKAPSLLQGGMAFLDRIFFDTRYFNTLLPDEVLAVGAHEFTHLNQRHGRKRFRRIFTPSLIVGGVIGLLVFLNFEFFDPVNFNEGKLMFSLTVFVFSFLLVSIAGLYVNAKWLRQQETECDLSAVKFVNGEAMASALNKLNELRPRKVTRLELLLLPFYPTLEQRINDIRTAEQEQKNQQLKTN